MHSLADTSTHKLGLLHYLIEKHKDGTDSELDSHPLLSLSLSSNQAPATNYV